MANEIIFEVKDCTKRFGPTTALNHVNFTIRKGEITGLIGENGSGKSTLSAIMTGIYDRNGGEMYFKGEKWEPKSMIWSMNNGIGIIVQEKGTINNITVAENIFLGEASKFALFKTKKGKTWGPIVRKKMYAAADKVENATLLAHVCGDEASAVGVNWAFAPVSDIDLNWRNPITNTRLYCNDYKKVAAYTTAYIKEIQKLNLHGCGKHFPGDGVDERDQHLVASVNSLSRENWMKTYGHIYKTQIENGVNTIMIGHILQPAWEKYLTPGLKDKDCMPGTLSKGIVTGLLRGELGFKGMITTDATTMAGMTTMMKRELAVPTTIAIGCDCFLFTKNLDEDYKFMKAGYENGIITPQRLDEAVTNVLAAKASIGLHKAKADGSIMKDPEAARKIVGCKEFQEDAEKIADNCITIIKEEKGVLPLLPKKYKKVLLYGLEVEAPNVFGFTADSIINDFQKKLENEGFEVTRFSPQKALKEGMLQGVEDMKKNYDLLLYCANLATKSNQTSIRIEWHILFGTDVPVYVKEIPTVFVSLENPYHLIDVPRVETFINTYGGSKYILNSLVDKLMGRSEFKGKDPVDSFCGMWDTHL